MRRVGVLVMVGFALVPLVLWVAAAPLASRFPSASQSLTSIGTLLALAGVTSFGLNLVLGGRVKVLERAFGGLDKLYGVHRINGRIAFLLLLGHGVAMSAAQVVAAGPAGLGFLLPRGGDWTVTLGLAALVLMAISIGLTLYARLGHETFVYVQRFFGLIFCVSALHVFLTPGTKAVSRPLTVYLSLLFALGVAAWVYRSLMGERLVPRRSYVIESVTRIGPDVIEVSMVPQNGSLSFVPGQFIYVTFESEAMAESFRPFWIHAEGDFGVVSVKPGEVAHQYHPFSITSAPSDGNLTVVVKAVGDYTRAMAKLERGARVKVEGPYGGFSHLRVGNPRQVWIAGGIGLTPFLSMARSLENGDHEIDFYYCMENGHQGYFLDELYDIADRIPRLRVAPIRRDRLGFVSASDIAGLTRGLVDKDILICGPPMMIDALARQFVELGVPRNRIHFEKFGFV
jgi:predicted ferric reductase